MAHLIDTQRINIEQSLQVRVETSSEKVDEYAEGMGRGEEFPPILVFYDADLDEFYVVDGFHRLLAHRKARPNDRILVEQRLGTRKDARWAAIAANHSHGMQRTNADKRNAVRLAILDPHARHMSTREIARHAGVSRQLSGDVRAEMARDGEIPWVKTAMQKAIEAIADPENEGLSNREVATKYHIAERTVRRARDAANGINDICRTSEDDPGEVGEDSEDEPRTCETCLNWIQHPHEDHHFCVYHFEEVIPGDRLACEDYDEVPPEEGPPDVPPPDYEDVTVIDAPDRTVKRQYGRKQYRRRKDCHHLDLPKDNPQLFAIELRNNFDREYLGACIAALRHLWEDDEE